MHYAPTSCDSPDQHYTRLPHIFTSASLHLTQAAPSQSTIGAMRHAGAGTTALRVIRQEANTIRTQSHRVQALL